MTEWRKNKHANRKDHRMKSSQPPHSNPRSTQTARTIITTTSALRTAA